MEFITAKTNRSDSNILISDGIQNQSVPIPLPNILSGIKSVPV